MTKEELKQWREIYFTSYLKEIAQGEKELGQALSQTAKEIIWEKYAQLGDGKLEEFLKTERKGKE